MEFELLTCVLWQPDQINEPDVEMNRIVLSLPKSEQANLVNCSCS